jgi:ankyrin repeat protein
MTFEKAHECIKRGDISALTRLLDSGLDPNLSNQFLWTLLMLAAVHGNTAIGRILVSRGANVDTTNDFECALSLAAQKGHVRFARWLLDVGASKHCRPHGQDLGDWIKQTSGLRPQKISTVLKLLRDHRLLH